MKPVFYKNIVTGEKFICTDIKNDRQIIDGVEFLLVQKNNQQRKFLMRKDALKKIDSLKNAN